VKVFFDTNVYIAEAILGGGAARILDATRRASWRTFPCRTVLDEVRRVLVERLDFSERFAALTQARILRRAVLVEPGASRHQVPQDPNDSPILIAALAAGVDYLVSNDAHFLDLDPFESMRIVSMDAYYRLLVDEGLLPEV
jgi:putative PIN family toxin of toxin-antitoxin system